MINTVLPTTPEAIQTVVEEVGTSPMMEVRKAEAADTNPLEMVTKAIPVDITQSTSPTQLSTM